MADAILRALAAKRPASPRVTLAYWSACGYWGASLFDGGEEVASATGAGPAEALEALAAFAESGKLTPDQTLAARMREAGGAGHTRPRRDRSALLD